MEDLEAISPRGVFSHGKNKEKKKKTRHYRDILTNDMAVFTLRIVV